MARILALLVFVTLAFSTSAFACNDHDEAPAQKAEMSIEAQQLLAQATPARACFNSADCLPNENCLNGMCVFGRCFSDIDCAIGERCVAGTCKR